MDGKRWQQVEKIIDDALELASDQRLEFIKDKAGNDAELLHSAQRLLNSIDQANRTNFLEPGSLEKQELFEKLNNEENTTAESYIGTRIGNFTVSAILGHGGMATVFKAERSDESIQQTVAIKILHSSLHSQESLIRFRMEQEILANLNHPNIAHFVDAGITKDDTPYFIMEYVDGMPVNTFSKQHQLDINQKVQLFQQLCKAVSFAHRNLVVHRDLKPNNIFVNKEGQVKVLDFSIAKLLDPGFSDQNFVQTRAGTKLLSPTYCAPEQFELDPITTATDVYTLGLVFYEILSGKKAMDGKNKTLKEIQSSICSPNFTKTLRYDGDSELSAIIMKATRKESEFRYESAGQLLEDLNRYCTSLPIFARKDSVRYRVSKFVKRHRKMASMVLFLIISAVSFGIYHYQEITHEREKAEIEAARAKATSDFLLSIFQSADIDYRQENLTAKELLDHGLNITSVSFQEQPFVKEFLLRNMADIYDNIGHAEIADSIYNESISLCKDITTENDLLRGKCLHDYGSYLIKKDLIKSEHFLNQAITIFAGYPDEKLRLAISKMELGWVKYELNKLERADSLLRESMEYFLSVSNPENEVVATNQLYLGWVKNSQAQYGYADSLFSSSASIFQKLGNRDSWLAKALTAQARNLYDIGKTRKAYTISEKALQISLDVYGENTDEYANALKVKGLIHSQQKQYQDAKDYLTRALSNYKESIGQNTSSYNIALNDLAIVYFRLGDFEKAIKSFKTLIESNKHILGPNHPEIATGLSNLATILDLSGQTEASIPYFSQAIEVAEQNYQSTHPNLLRFKSNAAMANIRTKNFTAAEELILNSLNIIEKSDKQHPEYQRFLSAGRSLYKAWGKEDKAAKFDSLLTNS